ncbi:MAG: RNA 3'-terminal phosphate cyclase [Candidatus Bipolaricaulota bacterium]|nr:RNA 3'-terminal phosphate cyclase [Candidatus Bipolaricaulota bacterium]MDW8030731.1 RNA 3'-terminal phosphate cyclase [Candidatus Bipolaricaulota bacterium]
MASARVLDGARGGGSVLRVGLGLAIALQHPIRVINIRQGRPNPGLQAQHLASLRAAAQLCQARVEGAYLGSREIEFHPGPIQIDLLKVQIETAGSVALALQPIQIALARCTRPVTIEIIGGGTYVQWAPPIAALEHVTFALLSRWGVPGHLEVEREGFYPKGGARVRAHFGPAHISQSFDLSEQGRLREIRGLSLASHHLQKSRVAERQAEAARKLLSQELPRVSLEIETRYAETLSPGSAVVLWADCEKTLLGGDALGERGISAERVGEQAASALLAELRSGATLDRHMADQIIPFLALFGGRFLCAELTDHVKTNIWVAEQITGRRFTVAERAGIWEIHCVVPWSI